MTSPLYRCIHAVLYILICAVLFHPYLSQARNGDDHVLVERFQSQLQQALAGDTHAMYHVARMFELGRGTEQDALKAVKWYQLAITKGLNVARAHLGVMYLQGNGIKCDLHKARALLQPAAEKGSATAQYYLGRMYEQGMGVRHEDLKWAVYWYQKAANNGDYLAIDRLKTLHNAQASNANPRKVTASTTTRKKAKPRKTAASTPTRKPVQIDSPARVLLRTVMQAKWQHAGRPSEFLPATTTRCHVNTKREVNCKSREQRRNIGDAIISYTSDATLSDFNNANEFQVSYVNTVLKVKPVARPNLDGKVSTARRPPNIPLGKQSVTHKLYCELKSINRLVCIKDKNATDTYTRAN